MAAKFQTDTNGLCGIETEKDIEVDGKTYENFVYEEFRRRMEKKKHNN